MTTCRSWSTRSPAQLTERGLDTHLLVHPVFAVERDPAGALTGLFAGTDAPSAAQRESVIQIHVDRIDDEAARAALIAALMAVLGDVRHAVEDWRLMVDHLVARIAALKADPPALPGDEVAEAIQFLEWLRDDNFTFLGVRDYRLEAGGEVLAAVPNSSLGVLRGNDGEVITAGGDKIEMSPRAQAAFRERRLLLITKTSARSRVHRRVAMDLVGIKHYGHDGRLTGGFQIVGLFTATAYTRSTRSIPYLRRKVASVLARAGYSPNSHSGRTLANVLDTYPRDELFQIDEDTLFHFASIILQLNERPRVRVLPRFDWFERFVSVLVYVPREPYGSGARAVIGRLLATAFNGEVASFVPFFPEGPLVRVHFTITRTAGALAHPDRARLESDVSRLMKTWPDLLLEALAVVHDPIAARDLFARYGEAFSATYRDAFPPATAVQDIATIEAMSADAPLGVEFQRGDGGAAPPQAVEPRPPAAAVGARAGARAHGVHGRRREHLSRRAAPDGAPRNSGCTTCSSNSSATERPNSNPPSRGSTTASARSCMRTPRTTATTRWCSSPGCHGARWRWCARCRAICARSVCPIPRTTCGRPSSSMPALRRGYWRCSRRASIPLSPCRRNSARSARRPSRPRSMSGSARSRASTKTASCATSSMRCSPRCAPTTIRPMRRGAAKPVIAIKFDSRKLDGMPLPRPRYEIFLCSPRLEAVHLRFGPVARGGIRWSDRPQDFRTEVLGLVKAQQVKNAVIVPVGAKGGFVPKRLPTGNRDAIQSEGVATYRIFMSTMLDMTDNLDLERVVPPPDLVRHDGDDPYLVVAADKGTATFSDIANEIARAHGFWLDDAFASGGSAGYDHKKMGITARGAWESVKRHFREMNVDIAASPFTVVGVGDMSGDVFGNGMLRERTIKLVAAFDHRDIFIDPDPDPAARLQGAPTAVQPAALELAGLRPLPDLSRRRRVFAGGEGDHAQRAGPRGPRPDGAEGDAPGGDQCDPAGAGRSVVVRRHRHLCEGVGRKQRSGGRPRQ